jgi:hypothetical protein
MDCILQISEIAASYSSSSDSACLSIYEHTSASWYNMPALLAYFHLSRSNDNVLPSLILKPATSYPVLQDYVPSSTTGSFPLSSG